MSTKKRTLKEMMELIEQFQPEKKPAKQPKPTRWRKANHWYDLLLELPQADQEA